MKKIIGILQPFDMEQKFYVYEDGNKLDSCQAIIADVPATVLKLSKAHNISQIDLAGPQHYAMGIKHKIQEVELQQYSTNTLTINCI